MVTSGPLHPASVQRGHATSRDDLERPEKTFQRATTRISATDRRVSGDLEHYCRVPRELF